jgi:hypothetical protein
LRNRKIDAVDLNGNFLFKGLLVRRVEIVTDPHFLELDGELQSYLRRGYGAGEALGGSEGRVVGFVMTIYRKLASSSVAALWMALTRRLARITSEMDAADASEIISDDDEVDDALADKGEGSSATPFFEGEADALRELIAKSKECMRSDQKGAKLVDLIKKLVVDENRKVLIFTEYRVTQAYLIIKIKEIIGRDPEIIHGGQTVDEKRAAVMAFEDDNPVLISTEAGGEGLNLHRKCHVMINYDLPWNPARISQRIGRLYRYGQEFQVIVFNFHAQDTIDNQIVSILFDRLDTIVREMACVGAEFNNLYAADIMGELLERIDISALLDEASRGHVDRTQERIDAALNEARKAKDIQDDILSHAGRGSIESLNEVGMYTTLDLANFLKRALPFLKIVVEPSSDDAERFVLRLPVELKGQFPEFSGRTVISATTCRNSWQSGKEALLDFSTSFLIWVIKEVSAEQFGGSYAAISGDSGLNFFAAFLARYQNDQGFVQSEKLLVVAQDAAESLAIDNSVVRKLLAGVAVDVSPRAVEAAERSKLLEAARDRAEVRMAEELTRFKHPNDLVLVAAAEVLSGPST